MTRISGLPLSDDVLALNPDLRSARSIAVAKPERSLWLVDDYDSELERAFACELHARGVEFRPHGFTVNLPGGVQYTPDFIAWTHPAQPSVMIYEVKGNLRMKNARDSRTRFRIAAGLYPCFTWIWVTRARSGQWVERPMRKLLTALLVPSAPVPAGRTARGGEHVR